MAKQKYLLIQFHNQYIECGIGQNGKDAFEKLFRFSYTANNPTEAITAGLKKVGRASQARMVVSRRNVMVRYFHIPSHEKSEIEATLFLQLSQHIPYALDDVIFDYRVIDQTQDGYSRIIVYILPKSLIEPIQQSLKILNISLIEVTVSSATQLAYYQSAVSGVEWKNMQTVAWLVMMSEGIEVLVTHKGQLVYSRLFNQNTLNSDIDKKFFIGELKKTKDFYTQTTELPNWDKMILLSDKANLKHTLNDISSSIKVPVVNTSQRLNVSEKILDLDSDNSFDFSDFSLIGLHSMPLGSDCNFLKKEIEDKVKIRSLNFHKTLSFGLILLLLTILLGEYYWRWGRYEAYHQKLKSLVKGIDQNLKETQGISSFVTKIKTIDSSRIFMVSIARELVMLVPDGLSFRTLSIDGEQVMTMQGYASNNSMVNAFQKALVGSERFTEVNLQFATQRKIFNKDVTDFKLVCRIQKGAE